MPNPFTSLAHPFVVADIRSVTADYPALATANPQAERTCKHWEPICVFCWSSMGEAETYALSRYRSKLLIRSGYEYTNEAGSQHTEVGHLHRWQRKKLQ